jgi:hypothetical protein
LGTALLQIGDERWQWLGLVPRIYEPFIGIDEEAPMVEAIFVEERMLPLETISGF